MMINTAGVGVGVGVVGVGGGVGDIDSAALLIVGGAGGVGSIPRRFGKQNFGTVTAEGRADDGNEDDDAAAGGSSDLRQRLWKGR
jgi:hypothetical protein